MTNVNRQILHKVFTSTLKWKLIGLDLFVWDALYWAPNVLSTEHELPIHTHPFRNIRALWMTLDVSARLDPTPSPLVRSKRKTQQNALRCQPRCRHFYFGEQVFWQTFSWVDIWNIERVCLKWTERWDMIDWELHRHTTAENTSE